MEKAARKKSKKIFNVQIVMCAFYFFFAFFATYFGVKMMQNANSVYARESASATEELSIPSIELSTPVIVAEYEGKNLAVPDQIAASYSVNKNKTLLYGHSSTIFHDLKNIAIDDEVIYQEKTFRVVSIETKKKEDISMKEILSETEQNTIVIMTCSGEAIPNTNGDHTHRLIIYAEEI